jgi:hypothetical protein
MKPTAVLTLSWILLASGAVVHAQAFQNLDFEQAMPVLTGDSEDDRFQDPADVLPHWIVATSESGPGEYYGISYNSYGHIGDWPPLIHVFGGDGASTDFPAPDQFRAVAGNYSAMLDPRGTWTSLQQTGLIPAGARSLRFSGKLDDEPFPPQMLFPYVDVSLNGMVLPIYELGPVIGATYRFFQQNPQVFQYGVNIPRGLAGTPAALRFYAAGSLASLTLDDIHFSPVAVPEPATLGLIATSALALVAARRRTKKHGA